MRPNIVNLRQFYSSRTGRMVKGRLRRIIRQQEMIEPQENVVGIGYAIPLLQAMQDQLPKPPRLVALMPAEQGAIYWPVQAQNISLLADEMQPPFAVGSLQRVVMLHALEYATRPDELLRIYWQMLAPGGRLLLIVPNRRGLWASMGATPFALGTPFTLAKIKELLAQAEFTLRDASAALYVPPATHPFWLQSAGLCELLGRFFFPRWGGLLVIEAEKQIYAGVREPVAEMKKTKLWAAQQQGVPA